MMRQSTTPFVIIGCCLTEGVGASDRIFASPSRSPSNTVLRPTYNGEHASLEGIVRCSPPQSQYADWLN